MLGARGLQIAVDLIDLALEVVDQVKARVDALAPRIGNLETVEQLPARDSEQVGDRTRMPEGEHRGVDTVLEHRLVLDQVKAKPSLLAL